jgi:hypothetical protein
MGNTHRTRYWQSATRDYRKTAKRDAAILKDIERHAKDIRFIRTPPATAAALLKDFQQNRQTLAGSIISHLRHNYTNYDRIAYRIADKNGVAAIAVPRNRLKGISGDLIRAYLRSIDWQHGDLSPVTDRRRVR